MEERRRATLPFPSCIKRAQRESRSEKPGLELTENGWIRMKAECAHAATSIGLYSCCVVNRTLKESSISHRVCGGWKVEYTDRVGHTETVDLLLNVPPLAKLDAHWTRDRLVED